MTTVQSIAPASPRNLFIVIGVALLVRIVLLLAVSPWNQAHYESTFLRSDAGSYYKLAVNLYANGQYSLSDGPDFYPDSFITPGYPVFLAGIFTVFGQDILIVLLAQLLLGVLTCALTHQTALALFGKTHAGDIAATAAGLLMALEPIGALYAMITVTETLFLFLFVASVYAFLRGVLRQKGVSLPWLALSGLLFGAGLLTRPVLQFFALLPMLYILIKGAGWKNKLSGAAVFGAVMLAAVAPWLVRNYMVFDAVGMSTVGQYNLLFGNAALMQSKLTGKPYDQVIEEFRLKYTDGRGKGDIDFKTAARAAQVGADMIKEHPMTYAQIHLTGAAMLLVVPGSGVYSDALGWKKEKVGVGDKVYGSGLLQGLGKVLAAKSPFEWAYIILYGLFMAIEYLAALAGLWWMFKDRSRRLTAVFLALAVLYFPLVTGPVGDTARYRMPVMPLVAVMAGAWAYTRVLRRERIAHAEPVVVATA